MLSVIVPACNENVMISKAVQVIDCDLQHPPEKIVEMYRLWEQGYESIEG